MSRQQQPSTFRRARLSALNLARKYWAYVQRRGYAFYAVARNLDGALDDLQTGKVQVVVMLNPDGAPRSEPGMSTVVDLAARRRRMLADEPTVRLLPSRNSGPAPQPPRDDGGFAERFLKERSRSRNARDI
jgi:hypothetical protein